MPPTPASLTVLVVDDDPRVLEMLQLSVEGAGHRTVAVASGKLALDALDGGLQPDLVVTDYAMPGMSGLELAQEIRGRWPALAVAMISGTGGATDDLPAGLLEFVLVKPVQLHRLREAIARFASGRESASPPTRDRPE